MSKGIDVLELKVQSDGSTTKNKKKHVYFAKCTKHRKIYRTLIDKNIERGFTPVIFGWMY